MVKKNIANIITVTRIIATLIMIFTQVLSVPFYIAYIYAGLSDVLDGFIARKLNIESNLGKKLDSISDLFFYTTMMIKIWSYLVKYLPTFLWVIIWSVLAIRIVLYIYIAIRKHSLMSNHTILNKLTGLLMFILPFLVNSKIFTTYSICVTLVALIAAIYEILLLNRQKNIHS